MTQVWDWAGVEAKDFEMTQLSKVVMAQLIKVSMIQVWDWADVEAKDFEMPTVLSIPDRRMDQGMLW